MGIENETLAKLPIIDFSKQDLIPGKPEWDSVKDQVKQALVEFGSFELFFHKFPSDLRKKTFCVLEELFDLPSETKMLHVSKRPFRSYAGPSPKAPLFENMPIEDVNVYGKVDSLSNLLWKGGNQSFSHTLQSFADQVSELNQMVTRMVLESLGVEKYLDEHMSTENYSYSLRLMKYHAPKTNETKQGLRPHRDRNMLTILHQNQVGGLEVQTKDGKWINVKPSPNSFILLVGEAFYAWTNGRLYPPRHRVMMTGDEARYSVGLFSEPRDGYLVKVPEELVDEQHPLLFKPFDYSQFLHFYITETGRQVDWALKVYCGV